MATKQSPPSDATPPTPPPGALATDAPGAEAPPSALSRLASAWQGPALLGAAALLVAGGVVAFTRRPVHDLTAAMRGAERALLDERPDDAIERLERDVRPHLSTAASSDALKRRFHVLRADARVIRERDASEPSAQAAEAIVRDYEAAVALGETLDPLRESRLAEALMRVGRADEALTIARSLPDEASDARLRMQRQAILNAIALAREEVAPAVAAARLDGALQALSKFNLDPKLSEEDRAWAFARQAELRLDTGSPDDAVVHLLQSIPRLQNPAGPEAGELLLLLGRGLFETGRLTDAAKQVARAQGILPATSPLQAEAGLALGRIAQLCESPDEARERFGAVIDNFPESVAVPSALLGLAESECALGAFDRASEAYQRAFDSMAHAKGPTGRVRREALDSLRVRAQERLDAGDPAHALEFATLAEKGGESPAPPAWINLTLAQAHRMLGEELLAPARLRDGSIDWPAVERVTRAEVRAHFAEASVRFAAHAKQMIGREDAAYGESLWSAADAADRAGDQDGAIRLFSEFAAGRPADPRRPGAVFRIAQAHEARGDYQTAADAYRSLIAENAPSGERFRSIVPLARCLAADADESNDAEAERLLKQAVSGEVMPPDAPEFGVALTELGALYHRQGRHAEAIERLTEAVERAARAQPEAGANRPAAADAPPGGTDLTRLMLADSLRQSASQISRTLAEAMPQATRAELASLREQRLRDALTQYDRVCSGAQPRDPRRLPESERIARRNGFFYRADCAFDLGMYDKAIDWYDEAAGRFADDPASLVAMMQIVNVYAQTGRWEEARTANERAHQRFRELPPDAFASKDLPLEREHWERWLEARSQLAMQHAGAAQQGGAQTPHE